MADNDNLLEDAEGIDGDKLIEDSANDAVGDTAVSETPKTDTETKPAEADKSNEAVVNWEEKAKALEKQFKEYQSGITPKLQELADLKKSPKNLVDELVEKLSEKKERQAESTIPGIEEEISSIDKDIADLKAAGYDENIFEIKVLKRNRNTLVRQLKQEKEFAESQTQTKMIGEYLTKYPKTTPEHISELTEILVEKQSQGKNYDLLDAEEVWQGRQIEKLAGQKAKEARLTNDKATGARTQDGDNIVLTKPEDEEMNQYVDVIAPPSNIDFTVAP